MSAARAGGRRRRVDWILLLEESKLPTSILWVLLFTGSALHVPCPVQLVAIAGPIRLRQRSALLLRPREELLGPDASEGASSARPDAGLNGVFNACALLASLGVLNVESQASVRLFPASETEASTGAPSTAAGESLNAPLSKGGVALLSKDRVVLDGSIRLSPWNGDLADGRPSVESQVFLYGLHGVSVHGPQRLGSLIALSDLGEVAVGGSVSAGPAHRCDAQSAFVASPSDAAKMVSEALLLHGGLRPSKERRPFSVETLGSRVASLRELQRRGVPPCLLLEAFGALLVSPSLEALFFTASAEARSSLNDGVHSRRRLLPGEKHQQQPHQRPLPLERQTLSPAVDGREFDGLRKHALFPRTFLLDKGAASSRVLRVLHEARLPTADPTRRLSELGEGKVEAVEEAPESPQRPLPSPSRRDAPKDEDLTDSPSWGRPEDLQFSPLRFRWTVFDVGIFGAGGVAVEEGALLTAPHIFVCAGSKATLSVAGEVSASNKGCSAGKGGRGLVRPSSLAAGTWAEKPTGVPRAKRE